MIQFPLYEALKVELAATDGSSATMGPVVAASALSKLLASSITYPHEVVRARLQLSLIHI